jgi:hypothetical protein
MIFLHDSMFLHRPFRPLELEGAVRFHWHFENTEVRDDRKISTYFSFLPRSEDLIAFLNESNTKWKGCFGGASIIDFEVVDQLEQKYEFISKLVTVIRTRKDRETFERVFGLVLYYEKYINESNCSNFGNIVQYPNAFQSQHQSIDTSAHQLSQARYDTAIIKVWRGR